MSIGDPVCPICESMVPHFHHTRDGRFNPYQQDTNGAWPEPHTPNKALRDVLQERLRQDTKWGEQNHDPYIYLAILLEEMGELAQAILHSQFGGDDDKNMGGFENVRKEAVHTAAVAMAMIECLDRGMWVSDDVCLDSLNRRE